MSAEPEGVPAVEGDKAETCPMCGGLCRGTGRTVSITPGVQREVESLVKGKVVAQTEALAHIGETGGVEFYDQLFPNVLGQGRDKKVRVLVIRAKENAGTGGKE
jgi:hypothetical protein